MDNKQTAVEWLTEQLPIRILNAYQNEIEKAKAMEKQQIIKSFNEGTFAQDEKTTAEQYYTETYKSDNNGN